MNTPSQEPTRNPQVTRGAELEQEKSSLHEELTKERARPSPATNGEEQARPQAGTRPHRSSRRKMLTKGLGVAAASVGAGALLELSSGTAQAKASSGVFVSSTASTPAVSATGSNGADGVDASSDSGIGVSATSRSGTALVATTSTGLAAHFVGGNVTMDKNLTVTGALSTGTLSSGAGAFTSSVSGAPAVSANSNNGADGIDASSDSGISVSGFVFGDSGGTGVSGVGGSGRTNSPAIGGTGVSGTGGGGNTTGGTGVVGTGGNGFFSNSNGGTGVHGIAGTAGGSFGSPGLAGLFDGDVKVNGNFSVSGTKNFVQAHPTDPGREIAYVALEGGEAGTYVRGSGQLQSGKAVIALPEHFGLVTQTSGLTIQLTPRGEWLQLYMVELDTAQLVVREAQGKSGAFDYLIHGVRKGYEQYEVIRMKH